MRREKMNNKGFSLVELIIVIAIMAILSAALAPQLMKYIEKSRVSTDDSSCTSIETCVNAALAEEAVYKQLAEAGGAGNLVFNVDFSSADAMPSDGSNITMEVGTGAFDKLVTELASSLGSLKAPKQTGMKYYVIEVESALDSASGTTQLGKIKVYTKSTKQTATTF
ncbi:MAG: type II secretion system protein [Lachnospiraceae bacterium]|nr:type II secretion system protein [Lachnospiraceae bacterium]